MAFQRVSTLKQWMIGSIESDVGSEYLFGFDPAAGLMWLERAGVEYGPQDADWARADAFIRQSSLGVASVGDLMSEGAPPTDPEEQYVVQMASSEERPRTVTKSVMGAPGISDDSLPRTGDPRIVGDFSSDGTDYSEDDIAAQAAEFLLNLGEGSHDGE